MNRFLDAVTFGPARRRRRMEAELAKLTEAYRSGASLGGRHDGFGAVRTRSSPPRGTGGSGASGLRLLLVLLVLAGVVVAAVLGARSLAGSTGSDSSAPPPPTPTTAAPVPSARPTDTTTGTPAEAEHPPAGVGASPDRLLPAVPPPPGSGGYAFLSRTDAGAPVTYDPCRPIAYVLRPNGVPADGERAVREAIAAVSAATGLAFVDGGRTEEAPSDRRPAYQPQRYGQRWAPLLIAWSTPAETPILKGATAGVGGSTAETLTNDDGEQSAYVSGSVVLDGPQLRGIRRNEGVAEMRAVVEHELGHVVGLDHVDDRSQLMYPENSPGITGFGTGDRRGLARLGAGPCTPGL